MDVNILAAPEAQGKVGVDIHLEHFSALFEACEIQMHALPPDMQCHRFFRARASSSRSFSLETCV